MPVHFTGNVCDMQELTRICKRHSIHLIEDAAPAFGATYRGRKAGSFGILGCFSMNPMKVLGAVGEAGAVITASGPLWSKLRDLRYHGMRNKETCVDVSLNARLDSLQAAVLSIRLQAHEQTLERRQAIARRYSARISSLVEIPKVATDVRHAWYHYTILCDRRDELAIALQKSGIETRIYHSRLMPGHPAHAGDLQAYPMGRILVDRILCLPMHQKLRDDEVDSVVDAIIEFYGRLP